jgi:hypothetical protein
MDNLERLMEENLRPALESRVPSQPAPAFDLLVGRARMHLQRKRRNNVLLRFAAVMALTLPVAWFALPETTVPADDTEIAYYATYEMPSDLWFTDLDESASDVIGIDEHFPTDNIINLESDSL